MTPIYLDELNILTLAIVSVIFIHYILDYPIALGDSLWYYLRHMEFLQTAVIPFLPYIQIGLSILLVAAILLQQRGSSLGGAFGGDNFSAAFNKRRGGEEFLFRFSIVIAVLFVLSTILNLFV